MAVKYHAIEFGYGIGLLEKCDSRAEALECIKYYKKTEGAHEHIKLLSKYRVEVMGCDHSKVKHVPIKKGPPGTWFEKQCLTCEEAVGGYWKGVRKGLEGVPFYQVRVPWEAMVTVEVQALSASEASIKAMKAVPKLCPTCSKMVKLEEGTAQAPKEIKKVT